MAGNSQFVQITSSKAYTSRITADGANIFDDQLTPVQEISGSTVKCDNLLKFPYDSMGGYTGKNITVSILDDGGIKIVGELASDEVTGTAAYRRLYLYSISSSKLNFTAEKMALNFYASNGFKTSKLVITVGGGNYFTENITWADEISLNRGTAILVKKGTGTQMTYLLLDIYPGQSFDCVLYIMLSEGTTPKLYQPYFTGLKTAYINSIVSKNQDGTQESVFQFPQTYELGKYDKILPQTGEIVRATGYSTSETGFTDEEIATYNNSVVSNDRKSLVYELATATTTPINAPKVYTAWNGGSETIVQGETDNSQFGAMPTVTQTYFGKVGEE